MIQASGEEKIRPLGLGPCHFRNLRPHLVLPAGIAGDGEHDLAVLDKDETWRRRSAGLAFLTVEESRADRFGGGWPTRFGRYQVGVGGIDHLEIDFGEGVRFLEFGFGLGTPDLTSPSKLVADEDQRRLARLGLHDAGQ